MAIKEASSANTTAPTEEIEAVDLGVVAVEETGGLAGYVMAAPGAVVPVSVFDDPATATTEEVHAAVTATEETRAG